MTTDAQTEARTIALKIATSGKTGRVHQLQYDPAYEAALLALSARDAAKDAELAEKENARAEQWRLRRETESARDMMSALAATFRAERDEARKALEPFADISDLIDAETEGLSETDELELHYHDYLMASWPVSLFRAARRAREAQGGENGQA